MIDKKILIWLMFFITINAWATNLSVTSSPDLNQYTVTSTNNAILINAGANLHPLATDAIIFNNTAPGTNVVANSVVPAVTIVPTIIPNGSAGTAIVVSNSGAINVDAGKLAINANAATSAAGGFIFVNNAGSIAVANGGDVISMGTTTASLNLVNTGTITGNIIGGNHSDVFNNNGGTIAGNIVGGAGGSTINLTGSSIISGSIIASTLASSTLNIGALTNDVANTFSTQGTIYNIKTINVIKPPTQANTSTFTVNNPIVGVANAVTTSFVRTTDDTIINITDLGDISGGGVINNASTINVSGTGTIGATVPMGVVNNSGLINAKGGNIKIGAINNAIGGVLNINQGTSKVLTGLDGSNVITNAGSLTIKAGDLSSAIIGTNLINSGHFTLSESGTMMKYSPISRLGDVVNGGTVTITNADGLKISGNFTNNNLNQDVLSVGLLNILNNVSMLSGNIYNTLGIINIGVSADPINFVAEIGGDLSSIDSFHPSTLINSLNQIININGSGTIGSHGQLATATNSGTINANGGDIKVTAFINNDMNAILNISKNKETIIVDSTTTIGITANRFFTGNIYNTLGSINIGGNASTLPVVTPAFGGDLSSLDSTHPANLINGANQTITVAGNGTIGAVHQLGSVTNSGVINANGGGIKFGNFINNLATASLNISKNMVLIGNVNNILGAINIGYLGAAGDLSSIDAVALIPALSSLINGDDQIITVAGTGTVGANGPLGAVNNNGIINAGGGNILIGNFTNDATNALLNITSNAVLSGNINNILGAITIGTVGSAITADLSSIGYAKSPKVLSTLNNAANQSIIVSGAGTIGANGLLGDVINNGLINADGGNIDVGNFVNNLATAALNITSGNIKTGNIANDLGSINIIGNGLVSTDLSSASSVTKSTLTNAAEQYITIAENGSLGANYDASGASYSLGLITNSGIINAATSVGFKGGQFINNLGANTTINNSASAVAPTQTAPGVYIPGIYNTGVVLAGVHNSGIFSIINTQAIANVSLGAVINRIGAEFNINGPITARGDFANQAGGTVNLAGNLDLGAATNIFQNSGTINMLSSITMLNGGYTLNAGGIHNFTIDNGIPRTLTLTNGACNLNGGTIQLEIIGNNFLFKDNQTFKIFAGSIAASLDPSVSVVDYNNVVSFGLERYAGATLNSDIKLTVHRTPYTNIFDNIDNNSEDPSLASLSVVGSVFDSLINQGINGDLQQAFSNLETLGSIEGLKEAATQLLPEANYATTSFDPPSIVFSAAEIKLEKTARLEIDSLKTNVTGYSAGGMQTNDGVWIKAIGGNNLQKQRDAFLGYNSNSYGTIVGIDSKVLDNTWLGIAGSFVGTHVKSKDFPAKITNITSYQTTAYASHSTNNYYIDGLVGMSFNTYKTIRNIQFANFYRQATAKFMGLQPSFKLAAGHIHQVDDFRLIPNVSLQYSILRQRAYSETGAGNASLKVDNADLTQLEAGIGFKLAMLQQGENGFVFNPDLHFMFLHDFKSQAQETTAEFAAGGGKFKVQGLTPNKDTYNVGAGITLISYDSLHFTANYEVRMKDKFVGHSGSIAVRYEF